MNTTSGESEKPLPLAYQAHVPGKIFQFSDGTTYKVQENGAWKKIQEATTSKKVRK